MNSNPEPASDDKLRAEPWKQCGPEVGAGDELVGFAADERQAERGEVASLASRRSICAQRDALQAERDRALASLRVERDAVARLQAEVEELRRRKRAAEFWERLVRMVVARPEWCTFYEADERGACDEVMIDYLAALQARLDAIREARSCLGAGPMDYEAFTDEVDRILAAVAALGVDPQKDRQAT